MIQNPISRRGLLLGSPMAAAQFYVPSMADPGGELQSTGPVSLLATQTIPTGTNQFFTEDGGRWHVDPAGTDRLVAAHPKAVAKTSNTRYFRRDVEALKFTYFGADPTGQSPCDTAFLEAMAYLKEIARRNNRTHYFASSPLEFDAGDFRFSHTIELHQQVLLSGHTRGNYVNNQGAATRLLFPANTTCLIVQRDDTNGEAGANAGGLGNAGGSILRGLAFVSAGGKSFELGVRGVGSGVVMRAQAEMDLCVVHAFPNCGVEIVANTGNPDGQYRGEASECRIQRSQIGQNRNHGVALHGIDVNIAVVEGCRTGYNGGWGILNMDAGPFRSVGNHYVSNGKLGTAGNTATSAVYDRGRMWGLSHNADPAFASLAHNRPQNTEADHGPWVKIRNLAAPLYDVPRWVPGIALRAGGAGWLKATVQGRMAIIWRALRTRSGLTEAVPTTPYLSSGLVSKILE